MRAIGAAESKEAVTKADCKGQKAYRARCLEPVSYLEPKAVLRRQVVVESMRRGGKAAKKARRAARKDVHLSNLTTFVVSTQNGDSVAVAHLEADEQRDGLNGIVSTVDVISHEEVVGIRRLASNSEQLDQVVPLSMNITANGHRAMHALDI